MAVFFYFMANPTYTGNLPSGNFGYGELVSLDNAMGLSAGNQATFNGPGGLVYQIHDNGNNTFSISTNGQTTAGNQALDMAQQLQQMQLAANQPAIQTLQTQYNPSTGAGALVDRYNQLLASITASGSAATNATTAATAQELAQRGILPSSASYGQSMGQALLPVNTAYGQLTAQTGLGEQQDLGNIAAQIASLQAGNVQGAITGATNIQGISQNASNIQAQLANALQLQQMVNQNNIQTTQIGQSHLSIQPGGGYYDPYTNSFVTAGGPAITGGYV